ncbi:beta-N-acetylhexosaminidase [Gemmatirosa kalamazoonensis]|nr:beta-N-acetylhexosaminidase [Gemmatirosa kalamazoonensis]
MPRTRHALASLGAVVALAACSSALVPTPPPRTAPTPPPARPAGPPPAPNPNDPNRIPLQGQAPIATLGVHRIVPAPVSVTADSGAPFTVTRATTIVVPAANADAERVGHMLAALLRPSTGFPITVSAAGGAVPNGSVVLRLDGAADLGAEGYTVQVAADSVRLTASNPAGLFYAVQTLRQLLPAAVESELSGNFRPAAWSVPAGRITDRPRFAWRGAMLDVARHFFTVDEVKQLVDILALYKLNTLHLHLTDDQGWRIQIRRRPRLTQVGGSSEVGGGPGGFYTQADYADIVRYAQDRFVTVVPEIDMPAHIHSAIVAYPELGCGRQIPDTSLNAPIQGLYVGTRVGFSALCYDKKSTYDFVDDVVRELAAMTPGPFLHLGGDEVAVLNHAQYAYFVERVQEIVRRHGKRMVGWDEIGQAKLLPGTIAQMWRMDTTMAAVKQGAKLVMSPAANAYLDMKYTPATETGLRWAAFVELRNAYDWDPVTRFPHVTESDVLGVEGPLWSETVMNITAAEYLIMPRLPALAEVAWTPQSSRDWESFRQRIAGHATRWRYLGINFFPSPQVPWEPSVP